MMVLKWIIPLDDQWHEIPCGRSPMLNGDKPLSIGMQHGQVAVWGTVHPESERQGCTVKIKVVGTGQEWDERNNYLGTTQDPLGFVWHVIAGGYG